MFEKLLYCTDQHLMDRLCLEAVQVEASAKKRRNLHETATVIFFSLLKYFVCVYFVKCIFRPVRRLHNKDTIDSPPFVVENSRPIFVFNV